MSEYVNGKKVNLVRNIGSVKVVRNECAISEHFSDKKVNLVRNGGSVKVVRNEIYTSKNKKLEKLIRNNCPKDEVVAFVIGADSYRLPNIGEMYDLLLYIPNENQKCESEPMLTVPKGKVSKEIMEKLILQIRNDYFTRNNLLLLWKTAKNVRKRKIIINVLVSMGIVIVAAGAVFSANRIKDRNKSNSENDDCINKKHNSKNATVLDSDSQINDKDEDDEMIPFNRRNSIDDFTQEEWDKINEYEFVEDWLKRDDELLDMSLEEYNEMRCIEEYGLCDDEMDCGDDD